MKFQPTMLHGAYLIEPEERTDDRGFFARMFCENEFAAHALETRFVQINNSLSRRRGTIRGFHFQYPPHAEVKVVRCLRGRILDTIIDIRPDSATRFQHFSVELDAAKRTMLYVPEGCAHGFQTLCDDTEVMYLVSAFYAPGAEGGIRWDDPYFQIDWPITQAVSLSPKDAEHPDFDPATFAWMRDTHE